MINLRVRPIDDKQIRISHIDPVLADCLYELPEIVEKRDLPAAHARLFPNPTDKDEKANADWQQFVAPDLRHLFVSAGEVVARDLTALKPEPRDPSRLQVTFPAEHVNAWMSALNQARLILAELFAVDERDIDDTSLDLKDPKQKAILKIHLLGYLLHLFVESQSGDEPKSSV
jgi:hypothetical protein